MTTSTKSISRVPRKPLAACCAAMFAVAAPEAFASTWTVTNCSDHDPGSLRAVIASPTTVSDDTIDLSQLSTCGSSISLTTGAIVVTQNSLFLQGPAGSHATVTGYYYGTRSSEAARVLTHTGTGTLGLNYLNVSYGNLSSGGGSANGGCIYSNGNVLLTHSQVYACKAQSTGPGNDEGGGIYAKGFVNAKYSQISGNKLSGTNLSRGAGVYAGNGFTASNSTINGNSGARDGGGFFALGSVSITNSTISGNTANEAGAFDASGGPAQTLTITNSTISGNIGSVYGIGGVLSSEATIVQNSTIAFNSAPIGKTSNGYYATGLAVFSFGSSHTAVNLQSSIISNNTYGNPINGFTELDFSTQPRGTSSITISGSGNLIRVAKGPQTPITTTACPMLGSLRYNGGLTLTHALMSHSPAIDAGNNNANLSNDQRESPFVRVSGPAPDIGAYEVQQNDIFNANFEGCPVLF